MNVQGVRIKRGLFFLVDGDGQQQESTKQEVRAYLERARADRNIDRQDVFIMFQGPYSPLSKEDIEAISRPTGVTKILQRLGEES